MTRKPRQKRRHGRQAKSANSTDADTATKKTDSLTFRTRPSMKADLEKAAAAANRSVSEQIEYLLGRAFEWERVLGDLEGFKARVAEMQRQEEAAQRHRAGWGKMYDPSAPGGVVWFPPGAHNIPQSGFVDENAPPAPPTLPPVVAEAVRAEVQSAVREILQEAGLLSQKKSGCAAA